LSGLLFGQRSRLERRDSAMPDKIEEELRGRILDRAREEDRRATAVAPEVARLYAEIGLEIEERPSREAQERAKNEAEDAARVEWKNSEHRGRVLEHSFPAFHQRVLEMLPAAETVSDPERERIHQLPLSVQQLARAAEQTSEFTALVADLFGIGRDTGWTFDGDASEAAEHLGHLIRRSGYYHAMLSGEWREYEQRSRSANPELEELLYLASALPPEKYWERMVDRVPRWRRVFTHFRLLRGCRFPRDRFKIAGYSVVRMSKDEVWNLGPLPMPVDDFYPDERFSLSEFLEPRTNGDRIKRQIPGSAAYYFEVVPGKEDSGTWFLELPELKECGYVTPHIEHEDRIAPPSASHPGGGGAEVTRAATPLRSLYGETKEFEIAAGVRESAPVNPFAERLYYPTSISDDLWPIVVLTLYSDDFFDIPAYFISEAGWRIIWLTREPRRSLFEPPPGGYKVTERDWPKFQQFVQLCEKPLERVFGVGSSEWGSVGRALRYYLRATFAKGAILPGLELGEDDLDIESTEGESGEEYVRGEMSELLEQKTETVAEEVLLHYVFCLEVLLTGDAEPGTTTKKIVTCAGILAGRDETETKAFAEVASNAYELRSQLVHGKNFRRLDLIETLPQLRHLCRRVLAVTLSLTLEHSEPEELKKTFHELELFRKMRPKLGRSRDKVLGLTGGTR